MQKIKLKKWRMAVNAHELSTKDFPLAGVPIAEIVWGVLSIVSLATLLRCLAC